MLWRESIDTNARSIAAAKAENNGSSALHAMDYTVYAELQLARDSDADAIVSEARSISTPAVVSIYARAAIPARYAVERDQWAEAATLPDPSESKYSYTEAMTLFLITPKRRVTAIRVSMAVTQTSPSPWAMCPSPAENFAPGA